jgi:hypothetical protein
MTSDTTNAVPNPGSEEAILRGCTCPVIEGHGAVYKRTAEFLVRNGLVEYCARWGGQPGILGYRITEAGHRALEDGGTHP